MQATHTADLDIPGLSQAATTAHIFPQLTNTLIFISQLCDNGCEENITANDVIIQHNNATILDATRDDDTGLWMLVTKKRHSKQHTANNIQHCDTKSDLVKYFHQCCFSLVTATWLKAVKAGYFTKWPGLTCDLINKHLPKSEATTKGHLQQQYQNTQSTKQITTQDDPVATTA